MAAAASPSLGVTEEERELLGEGAPWKPGSSPWGGGAGQQGRQVGSAFPGNAESTSPAAALASAPLPSAFCCIVRRGQNPGRTGFRLLLAACPTGEGAGGDPIFLGNSFSGRQYSHGTSQSTHVHTHTHTDTHTHTHAHVVHRHGLEWCSGAHGEQAGLFPQGLRFQGNDHHHCHRGRSRGGAC